MRHIFWDPLEPSQRPPGRSWTSVWELLPCHHQHLLFSNQRYSKECSLEQALILYGPIRSLPCLLFPASSKVLTNDRWPNVETTADNKSTQDEKQKTTWACNDLLKARGFKCSRGRRGWRKKTKNILKEDLNWVNWERVSKQTLGDSD